MACEPGRTRPIPSGQPIPATPALGYVPAHWVPRAAPPPLLPGQVHVWAASLDVDDAALAELGGYLNDGENDKARRFRIDVHRRRYIAARGQLRYLIGEYTGVAAHAVDLRCGARGKPFLGEGGSPALAFNATDSDGQALYAFARDMELGIDVECLPRDIGHDSIAARHFAEVEVGALRGFPANRRQQAFLACWTRKEAYGKAEGVGIRYALDSVCLCDDLTVPAASIGPGESLSGRTWTLQQFQPDFSAVASLVVSEASCEVRFFRLDRGH